MKKVLIVFLVVILFITCCACDNKNKKELTVDNWDEYIDFDIKVDAAINERCKIGDNLTVYEYCNLLMSLTSKSDRLTFEDVSITFDVDTRYADWNDNFDDVIDYSYLHEPLELTEETHEVTIDLDYFGNGDKMIEVFNENCYLPVFPNKGFRAKSVSGYVILD